MVLMMSAILVSAFSAFSAVKSSPACSAVKSSPQLFPLLRQQLARNLRVRGDGAGIAQVAARNVLEQLFDQRMRFRRRDGFNRPVVEVGTARQAVGQQLMPVAAPQLDRQLGDDFERVRRSVTVQAIASEVLPHVVSELAQLGAREVFPGTDIADR